jgi:hypothetical protein
MLPLKLALSYVSIVFIVDHSGAKFKQLRESIQHRQDDQKENIILFLLFYAFDA